MTKKNVISAVMAVVLAVAMLAGVGSQAFAAKNDTVTIPIYIAGEGLDTADQTTINDMSKDGAIKVTVDAGATVQEAIEALEDRIGWTVVFTTYNDNEGLTSINGLAEESKYGTTPDGKNTWDGKYWNISFTSATAPHANASEEVLNQFPTYKDMKAGEWYELPVYANHAVVGVDTALTFTEYNNAGDEINIPVEDILINGITLTYTAEHLEW